MIFSLFPPDQGIVTYEPCSVGGLVSGLNVSSDVLLKQSPEMQTLGTVHVLGTLEAKGELHILSQLNGINFPKMMEFFSAPGENAEGRESVPVGIETHGNVYFEHDPTVIHLNGHNVQKLYGEVWLPHRPTVLTGRYQFESVEFVKPLHTKVRAFDGFVFSFLEPFNIHAFRHRINRLTTSTGTKWKHDV